MAEQQPPSDRAIEIGRLLANPPPGEEIVITGVAGRFPDSDDMNHFRDNLYDKVDLVSGDFRRWMPFMSEIPQRTGKINNISKHDAGFFGMHAKQAHMMEPMCRMLLEHSVEAILDAGVHPSELEGTRTGVFVGMSFTESESTFLYERLQPKSKAITGYLRSMYANHISYHLRLQGPSVVVDTACSSSLHALEHAFRAIRNGECDSALVSGSNLVLNPYISLQFARLGVLSPDGRCKSFDESANGYARSEAVSVVFVQKAKDSRRIYSKIVYAKINCDGYKEEGITFPSKYLQKKLLDEFYLECDVDPSTLTYVEAHGTGTRVGDLVEADCLDEFFCTNRDRPLLVGTVKTNLGHSEPASGFCSIAKMIIAMENGHIPANLNFKTPRQDAKGLVDGRMKVVVDKTPWPDNNVLVALSNFGFGGANCHVLLQRNQKAKVNRGQPTDDLPRLVCVSGRTGEAVHAILDDLKSHKVDVELIRLYHEVFKYDIPGHLYRGYSLLSKFGELTRSVLRYDGERRPLYYVFGGHDANWSNVGTQLRAVPLFCETIQKIDHAASQFGFNLDKLMTNCNNTKETTDVADDIFKHVAVQLALVDMLRALDVRPDHVVGCSIGNLAAAYCNDSLSLEQAVACAYHAAQWAKEVNIGDVMAVEVEATPNKIRACLCDGVDIINETSNGRVVISGKKRAMRGVTLELQRKGVLYKDVFGYFPTKINGNNFILKLKEVLSQSKSSSSTELFVNSLTDPMSNDIEQIKAGGAIVKFGHVNVANVADPVVIDFARDSFMDALGKLYETGQNPRLERLYPHVEYPVSRGTPMISPAIKWEHSQDWFVYCHKDLEQGRSGERVFEVVLKDPDWEYVSGHVIDGRNLFPATGYLYVVCKMLATNIGSITLDFRVVFEDVRFLRATTVSKDYDVLELVVTVQEGSGRFEIAESGSAVVTGTVTLQPSDYCDEDLDLPMMDDQEGLSMTQRDVYKELRLRGYNYSGLFKGIVECDISASRGMIQWTGNWVAFMDNLLQMQILQVDSRNLYVPTGIKRFTFDGRKHNEMIQQLGENPKLPVYVYKDSHIIKSGAVEIRGLSAAPIPKRKFQGEPVLEKYQFVPNVIDATTVDESVRVNMQIVLENSYEIKFRAVELVDEHTPMDADPLGPIVHQVLGDQPLIQPEIIVLSKKPELVANTTVEDKKLSEMSDFVLVVASKLLGQPRQVIHDTFKALKPNGFVLSRESADFDITNIVVGVNIEVLTVHGLPNEKLVMFRRTTEDRAVVTIDVGLDDFAWLSPLQSALKSDSAVVVYAQNRPQSGVIGLLNCLRREPGCDRTRCVFINDGCAPKFDPANDLYKKQLKKGLSVNVYKDGRWGTYRHLLLGAPPLVDKQHCYVNVTVRGDLSSLKWIEGPLKANSIVEPETTMVDVYYSALNFRDIMTASGRISSDVVTMNRTEQDCLQGIEFSGRDRSGRRVMGMVNSNALSTILAADSHMLFDVPDDWTLEDAATVPVVYGTVLYALFMRGNLKPGQSILIHAGSGGVGQAAINVALEHGCIVFTTVGTDEKRQFIKKHFPKLTDRNIGNSRDTSFEQLIHKETKGRGVDYVLNSLAEDKLQASARCLAPGGTFLEIGKFDLASNNPIKLSTFDNEGSFHGVMLDGLFKAEPTEKMFIRKHLMNGIKKGYVKPLIRTVFKKDEIEDAFRYMAAGKHMGKVLIQIRDDVLKGDAHKPDIYAMSGVPRYYCTPECSHIITGGLGGFGLELADWLVLRGCRKLVLTSRNGIKNGYQQSRVRTWKSYGVIVNISTVDITTRKGCEQLLQEAHKLGSVEAIFNLAVVLKDAILENQTTESYKASFGPKAFAAKHLDEASRNLCPRLRDFVVFSSVSCGRGNPGQTNYGMANSVMERICEQRKKDGLPGLAVEWGAVGEVGLVADMQKDHMELTIGGTLQQKIASCLDVLDVFLKQDAPVVSSMVVAVKRANNTADNVVDCVANIMGLKNLKTISPHSTLPELGMDSMMAVEIKQTLERDFEVFLTPEDMRSMTLARLHEIQAKAEENEHTEKPEIIPEGMQLLLRFIGQEETANSPIIRVPSLIDENKTTAATIFMVPGVEGNYNMFEKFAAKVDAHVLCLQLCYDNHKETAHEMALQLFSQMEQLQDKSKPYILIAYSFGCIVSLELVALLEDAGYTGEVIFVDGAPRMLYGLMAQQINVENEAEFETDLLCGLISLYMSLEAVLKLKDLMYQCKSYDERMSLVLEHAPKDAPFSKQFQHSLAIGLYKRLKIVVDYTPSFAKLTTGIKLFRPTHQSITDLPEDYGLSDYVLEAVPVTFYEGNHITLLTNDGLIEQVNRIIVTVSNSGNPSSHDVPFMKESILSEHDGRHKCSVKQI